METNADDGNAVASIVGDSIDPVPVHPTRVEVHEVRAIAQVPGGVESHMHSPMSQTQKQIKLLGPVKRKQPTNPIKLLTNAKRQTTASQRAAAEAAAAAAAAGTLQDVPTTAREILEVTLKKKPSSKFRGVTWNKWHQKWTSQIRYQGKQHHLGVFTDPTEAAKAYDAAAMEHHGSKAVLNFASDVDPCVFP